MSIAVDAQATCPLCGGSFSADYLEVHAATCGEPEPGRGLWDEPLPVISLNKQVPSSFATSTATRTTSHPLAGPSLLDSMIENQNQRGGGGGSGSGGGRGSSQGGHSLQPVDLSSGIDVGGNNRGDERRGGGRASLFRDDEGHRAASGDDRPISLMEFNAKQQQEEKEQKNGADEKNKEKRTYLERSGGEVPLRIDESRAIKKQRESEDNGSGSEDPTGARKGKEVDKDGEGLPGKGDDAIERGGGSAGIGSEWQDDGSQEEIARILQEELNKLDNDEASRYPIDWERIRAEQASVSSQSSLPPRPTQELHPPSKAESALAKELAIHDAKQTPVLISEAAAAELGELFSSLPTEMQLHVLSKVPLRNITNCALTCRAWNELVKNPGMWQERGNTLWGGSARWEQLPKKIKGVMDLDVPWQSLSKQKQFEYRYRHYGSWLSGHHSIYAHQTDPFMTFSSDSTKVVALHYDEADDIVFVGHADGTIVVWDPSDKVWTTRVQCRRFNKMVIKDRQVALGFSDHVEIHRLVKRNYAGRREWDVDQSTSEFYSYQDALKMGEGRVTGEPTCTLDFNDRIVCAQFLKSQFLFMFGRNSERKISRIMLNESLHPSPFDLCIEPTMVNGKRIDLIKLVAYLPAVKKTFTFMLDFPHVHGANHHILTAPSFEPQQLVLSKGHNICALSGTRDTMIIDPHWNNIYCSVSCDLEVKILATHVDEEKVVQFLDNGEIRFISPHHGGLYCILNEFRREPGAFVAAVISPHYFVAVDKEHLVKFGRCMGNFERQCSRWEKKMNVLKEHGGVGSDGLVTKATMAQFISEQDKEDCYLYLFHYLEDTFGRIKALKASARLEERSELQAILRTAFDTYELCDSVLNAGPLRVLLPKRRRKLDHLYKQDCWISEQLKVLQEDLIVKEIMEAVNRPTNPVQPHLWEAGAQLLGIIRQCNQKLESFSDHESICPALNARLIKLREEYGEKLAGIVREVTKQMFAFVERTQAQYKRVSDLIEPSDNDSRVLLNLMAPLQQLRVNIGAAKEWFDPEGVMSGTVAKLESNLKSELKRYQEQAMMKKVNVTGASFLTLAATRDKLEDLLQFREMQTTTGYMSRDKVDTLNNIIAKAQNNLEVHLATLLNSVLERAQISDGPTTIEIARECCATVFAIEFMRGESRQQTQYLLTKVQSILEGEEFVVLNSSLQCDLAKLEPSAALSYVEQGLKTCRSLMARCEEFAVHARLRSLEVELVQALDECTKNETEALKKETEKIKNMLATFQRIGGKGASEIDDTLMQAKAQLNTLRSHQIQKRSWFVGSSHSGMLESTINALSDYISREQSSRLRKELEDIEARYRTLPDAEVVQYFQQLKAKRQPADEPPWLAGELEHRTFALRTDLRGELVTRVETELLSVFSRLDAKEVDSDYQAARDDHERLENLILALPPLVKEARRACNRHNQLVQAIGTAGFEQCAQLSDQLRSFMHAEEGLIKRAAEHKKLWSEIQPMLEESDDRGGTVAYRLITFAASVKQMLQDNWVPDYTRQLTRTRLRSHSEILKARYERVCGVMRRKMARHMDEIEEWLGQCREEEEMGGEGLIDPTQTAQTHLSYLKGMMSDHNDWKDYGRMSRLVRAIEDLVRRGLEREHTRKLRKLADVRGIYRTKMAIEKVNKILAEGQLKSGSLEEKYQKLRDQLKSRCDEAKSNALFECLQQLIAKTDPSEKLRNVGERELIFIHNTALALSKSADLRRLLGDGYESNTTDLVTARVSVEMSRRDRHHQLPTGDLTSEQLRQFSPASAISSDIIGFNAAVSEIRKEVDLVKDLEGALVRLNTFADQLELLCYHEDYEKTAKDLYELRRRVKSMLSGDLVDIGGFDDDDEEGGSGGGNYGKESKIKRTKSDLKKSGEKGKGGASEPDEDSEEDKEDADDFWMPSGDEDSDEEEMVLSSGDEGEAD